MLKYQPLFTFLAKRQPQLASELMQAYGNTMRWYYSSHFTRYEAALLKLPLHITTKQQLLGEDASKLHATHDPFNLGRRIDILHSRSTTAIPSHLAEVTATNTSSTPHKFQTHYHIETPFHSFTLALIDNASFEYTFLSSFLPTGPTRVTPPLNTLFTHIFAPTLTLAMTLTKRLTPPDTLDALGILLCLRLTQHFAFLLQRRKIPVLEPHTNATAMHLWPRLQAALDAHSDSLRRLTASLPTRSASSALTSSLLLGTSSSSAASTAPLPLTQRFGAFCAGVLALSSEAGDDEPVSRSLQRLKAEFEAVLARMALGFGAGDKGKRERDRFLTNQYALLVAVTGDGRGRLAEEIRGSWRVGAGGKDGEGVV